VMRRIMILSYCFVNIQLTFHLPPKRAAQHASPDCSDVSYPLDTPCYRCGYPLKD
jgi:hypothetical protein